jgi:arginase
MNKMIFNRFLRVTTSPFWDNKIYLSKNALYLPETTANISTHHSEISQIYKKTLFSENIQKINLPSFQVNVLHLLSNSISIIEIPMKYGQNIDGVDKGPEFINNKLQILCNNMEAGAIRQNILKIKIKKYNSLLSNNALAWAHVIRQNNTNSPYKAHYLRDIGLNSKKIAEVCYAESIKNNFVLTLGGDHSISIGSISGILKKNPDIGIIWIDAHPDIHTIKSSNTNHIHGMVNGFLLRLININKIQEFTWMNDYPQLNPNQIAYIGLRSIDKSEQNTLVKLQKDGMFVSTINDIKKKGIEEIINKALISLGKRKIHISFDIDSIDPLIAPSTGTKCNNGLSYDDTLKLISLIKSHCNITSMDIVEFNPNIGNKIEVDKTIKIISDIIKKILHPLDVILK